MNTFICFLTICTKTYQNNSSIELMDFVRNTKNLCFRFR